MNFHIHIDLGTGRLLLVNCLLACQFILSHSQGFLLTPLSRARAIGFGEVEASSGNGLGLPPYRNVPFYSQVRVQPPDVCGDPHEGVGSLLLRYIMTPHQATYAEGQVISVTVRTSVQAGGWFRIKMCPTAQVNPSQECFDGHTLTNVDTGYTRWWIQDSGSSQGDVPDAHADVVTRWQLPSGVSCSNGCIMQLTYQTATSCVDTCDPAECGPVYATQGNPISGQTGLPICGSDTAPQPTVFKDCADVLIKPATAISSRATSTAQQSLDAVQSTTSQLTSATEEDEKATARFSRMLVASSSASSRSFSSSETSEASIISSGTEGRFSALPPPPPRCGYSAADFCADRAPGFYGDRCTACTKYYRCGADEGDAYLSCPSGMAMGTGGSAKACALPGHGIIC